MNLYKAAVRPLLFRLSADFAHELTIDISSIASKQNWITGIVRKMYKKEDPRLHQSHWGLDFNNPVGLAAGFDKNGEAAALMESLGFGFLEIGSVSANACTGNQNREVFG